MNFKWAPDDSRIAYRADQDTDNVYELYTASPTGGATVKESGNPGFNGVIDYKWAPDSNFIAFRKAPDAMSEFELFTAVKAGIDAPVRVSADLTGLRDVTGFKWAPDSSLIAYLADPFSNDVFELFTTPPDGSWKPRLCSRSRPGPPWTSSR